MFFPLTHRPGVARVALALYLGVLMLLIPARSGQADPTISISLDRGEGATYTVGDPISVTYNTGEPAWVRFTTRTDDGERTLAEGFSSTGGGTLQATVGQPTGRHTLIADVYTGPDGSSIVATAVTWFVVVAAPGSSSVPTPSAPPQRVILSGVDSGRTVQVPVGSTIDISFLDTDYRWGSFQYDSYVLQLNTPPGIFPTSFTAKNTGSTAVSAVGTAECRNAPTPCFQPDRTFQITVIVQ